MNNGKFYTEYQEKKLSALEIELPLADGSELKCKVSHYFTLNNKEYFALYAVNEDGTPDTSVAVMLYEVVDDEEKNPVVIYIEDDNEYAMAAAFLAAKLS